VFSADYQDSIYINDPIYPPKLSSNLLKQIRKVTDLVSIAEKGLSKSFMLKKIVSRKNWPSLLNKNKKKNFRVPSNSKSNSNSHNSKGALCTTSMGNYPYNPNFQDSNNSNSNSCISCRNFNLKNNMPSIVKADLQNGYKALTYSSKVCRIYKEIDPYSLISSRGFLEFRKR